MLGRKELSKRKKWFVEFLCQKDEKEYVVTVPGCFDTEEEAILRLTKYSEHYFTSKGREGTEYLGLNLYRRFVCE